MKFSVIIPVYKVPENYLRRCIESVIAQEMHDFEVILVEDGSPDNCGDICDEYKKKCERIRVIHKQNEGVSVARNVGIESAKGEYIIFVDGDDEIFDGALINLSNILEKNDADISIFKYVTDKSHVNKAESKKTKKIDEIDIEKLKSSIINMEELYENICIGSSWGKVYRRDFLLKNNIRFLQGVKKAQDRVFVLTCLKYGCHIQVVDYTLYYYNVGNATSICNRYSEDILETLLNTGIKIEELVSQTKFEKDINRMYIQFIKEIMFLNVLHQNNPQSFSDKVNYLKQLYNNEKIHNALYSNVDMRKGFFTKILLGLFKNRCFSIILIIGRLALKIIETKKSKGSQRRKLS